MLSTQNITTLKNVTILPFLFTCLPIAFIYLFLRDIPLLSSLFSEYINSGTSLFFPFLSSNIIVFQFTIGHLIDIIIVNNIVVLLESGGYHYYMNVCLRGIYSETCFLEINRTQDESSLKLDSILRIKDESNTLFIESSAEFNFYEKNRIRANYFSSRNGYCSSLIKIKLNNLKYLHKSHKKITQYKNYYTPFRTYSTSNLVNYHLPSKNNCLFSYSNIYTQQEEGI